MVGVFSLLVSLGFSASSMGASQSWEQEFINALTKAKEAGQAGQRGEGLGYNQSPEQLLDEAIQDAMAQGGPPCQILRMAVDMDFNPYPVLLSIYSQGSVDLDEVCMCATEQGVGKAVIAQAATSASGPSGTPAYNRDEIAQSQCLQEGLPYTPAAMENPPQPESPDPIPPDSVSSP